MPIPRNAVARWAAEREIGGPVLPCPRHPFPGGGAGLVREEDGRSVTFRCEECGRPLGSALLPLPPEPEPFLGAPLEGVTARVGDRDVTPWVKSVEIRRETVDVTMLGSASKQLVQGGAEAHVVLVPPPDMPPTVVQGERVELEYGGSLFARVDFGEAVHLIGGDTLTVSVPLVTS